VNNFILTNYKTPIAYQIISDIYAPDGHKIQHVQYNESNLLFPEKAVDRHFYSKNYSNLFINGYIRSKKSKNHLQDFIDIITKNEWPLPNTITGSFSGITETENDIFLFNDTIGFYPLYYHIKDKHIVISSNLICLAAITRADIDWVGVVEKLLPCEYCNFGRRTVLSGCKRLLPGEFIRFDKKHAAIYRSYDNTLYKGADIYQKKADCQQYWHLLKEEHDLALENDHRVNVALSGGLDSRLTFIAIPPDKEVNCLNYGESDFYETQIARKVARLKKAGFQNTHDYDLYFPEIKRFRNYVQKFEAYGAATWHSMIENANYSNTPIIFGDMCEALPGRNIQKYSSREARRKYFIQTSILNQQFNFTPGNDASFENWQNGLIHSILDNGNIIETVCSNTGLSYNDIKNLIINDIKELTKRVYDHDLPFAELYDELWNWYTHARLPMARQILQLQDCYYPIAPIMSIQILRQTSNIHPNLRLGYRTFDQLFKNIPEFSSFKKIPTAQIPWIPYGYPNFIKLAVWGFRSMVDQRLIKRMIKHRNKNLRYRTLNSLNWVKIYQSNLALRHIDSWFDPDYLGIKNAIVKKFMDRKELKAWPLTNDDLMAVGSLNVLLHELYRHKQKYVINKKL
jgi:hypothetical protein